MVVYQRSNAGLLAEGASSEGMSYKYTMVTLRAQKRKANVHLRFALLPPKILQWYNKKAKITYKTYRQSRYKRLQEE